MSNSLSDSPPPAPSPELVFGKPVPIHGVAVPDRDLAHRHGAGPEPRTARREVGQRGTDRRRARRPDAHERAAQRRRVVGEAHHDLDPLAEVPHDRYVSARVRSRNPNRPLPPTNSTLHTPSAHFPGRW